MSRYGNIHVNIKPKDAWVVSTATDPEDLRAELAALDACGYWIVSVMDRSQDVGYFYTVIARLR